MTTSYPRISACYSKNRVAVKALTWCCLVILSTTSADSGCRQAKSGSDTFKISVATGGGFTGVVTGFNLHANGKVEAWRRFPAQPDSILWTVDVEPVQIEQIARNLERTGAFKSEYEVTGNFTTRIIFSSRNGQYSWSWSDADDAPPKLRKWYGDVRRFCRELRINRQQQRESTQ